MNKCRLYSDFNCPFCYAMHERLHALGVMDRITWQGVQHAPHLAVPMATWASHMAAELQQEVELVRRLAPEVSITVPKGKPNTRRAIAQRRVPFKSMSPAPRVSCGLYTGCCG